MSETIPDDVIKAARVPRDALTHMCIEGSCAFDDHECRCLLVIARALLAERERAARIAETLGQQMVDEGLWGGVPSEIAAAIRRGQE